MFRPTHLHVERINVEAELVIRSHIVETSKISMEFGILYHYAIADGVIYAQLDVKIGIFHLLGHG